MPAGVKIHKSAHAFALTWLLQRCQRRCRALLTLSVFFFSIHLSSSPRRGAEKKTNEGAYELMKRVAEERRQHVVENVTCIFIIILIIFIYIHLINIIKEKDIHSKLSKAKEGESKV